MVKASAPKADGPEFESRLRGDFSGSSHTSLVLFVLQVAHKASTRARQRCRSAETRSRRPHVQPFSFISLSTVLLQVSLGRPLFLWPSGVHRRAILVKAVVCWRSTCPIHRQRLRLTWVEMGSISALRCSSSLVMIFGQ